MIYNSKDQQLSYFIQISNFSSKNKILNILKVSFINRNIHYYQCHFFQIITNLVIIFNSVIFLIDTPTAEDQIEFINLINLLFLIYDTIQATLKIIALVSSCQKQDLILPKKEYLREIWSIQIFQSSLYSIKSIQNNISNQVFENDTASVICIFRLFKRCCNSIIFLLYLFRYSLSRYIFFGGQLKNTLSRENFENLKNSILIVF
ncbi:unnamed protein product [Paramecium sonneborni]|uniref:Transmembrane protein n=1 Tax=Paramecium sonneborni TaxID=65129 RepID=A0A8S1R9V2_9CILI|nr:unnamed protein product [Paramecium sonneborni]